MARPVTVVCAAVVSTVLAVSAQAQTDHVKDGVAFASAYFEHNDPPAPGGQRSTFWLNVSSGYSTISIPPSLQYSGSSCTIAGCFSMPGTVAPYCWCDSGTQLSFSGSGPFPVEALQVTPQGSATLELAGQDIPQVPPGIPGVVACSRLSLTFTPDGQWHESSHGSFQVDSPNAVINAIEQRDTWSTRATGRACTLDLTSQGTSSGSVQTQRFNRVQRTPKP